MLKNKKGIALNQAFPAILLVILAAVLVIISLVVFSSLNTSFAGTSSGSVINESITPTGAGVTLNAASNCSSGGFVITQVLNGTTSQVINSGNYTLDTTTGVVRNTTGRWASLGWNVTYTYTWGSEACNAGESLITQFATYPTLIGLVGTIIFLSIVVAVLISSFVVGGRKSI